MAKPTIVFVPGIWEGPSVFDGVSKTLQSYGYSTAYAPLASTGHASPGNPTLLDDVQHIRSAIEPIVEEGKEIILVGHSAGGFLGSAAVKDLGLKKRAEDEKTGGVAKLIYLAAGLAPEGWRHPDVLPFFDIQVILHPSYNSSSSIPIFRAVEKDAGKHAEDCREMKCTAKSR